MSNGRIGVSNIQDRKRIIYQKMQREGRGMVRGMYKDNDPHLTEADRVAEGVPDSSCLYQGNGLFFRDTAYTQGYAHSDHEAFGVDEPTGVRLVDMTVAEQGTAHELVEELARFGIAADAAMNRTRLQELLFNLRAEQQQQLSLDPNLPSSVPEAARLALARASNIPQAQPAPRSAVEQMQAAQASTTPPVAPAQPALEPAMDLSNLAALVASAVQDVVAPLREELDALKQQMATAPADTELEAAEVADEPVDVTSNEGDDT